MYQNQQLSHIEKRLYILIQEYVSCLSKYCHTLSKTSRLLHVSQRLSNQEIEKSIDAVERFIYVGKRIQKLLQELRKM